MKDTGLGFGSRTRTEDSETPSGPEEGPQEDETTDDVEHLSTDSRVSTDRTRVPTGPDKAFPATLKVFRDDVEEHLKSQEKEFHKLQRGVSADIGKIEPT